MRLTLVPTLFDHFFKGIRGLIIHIRHAHLDQVDGDPHQWIRYQAIPYDDAILLSESEDPKEPVMIANGEMGPMPYKEFLLIGKLLCEEHTSHLCSRI